jgi:hypothetical protein
MQACHINGFFKAFKEFSFKGAIFVGFFMLQVVIVL